MQASPEDQTTEPTICNAGGKTRRCLLISLSVALVVAMIIGIIFVAHSYYDSWGGQGFLRVRSWEIDDAPVKEDCKASSLQRALPLSSYFTDVFDAPIESSSAYISTSSTISESRAQDSDLASDNDDLQGDELDPELKTKRKNVPFYICGDQSISCEAFNQPVCPFPVPLPHLTTKPNNPSTSAAQRASPATPHPSQTREYSAATPAAPVPPLQTSHHSAPAVPSPALPRPAAAAAQA
jgi:hypothetical protein